MKNRIVKGKGQITGAMTALIVITGACGEKTHLAGVVDTVVIKNELQSEHSLGGIKNVSIKFAVPTTMPSLKEPT